MNYDQFTIWEKQKWREYEAELKKLEEDFAARGLAFSGIRNREEKELKVKYDSEIEIARLGIKENEGDTYVEILEWANDRVKFNDQELYTRFPKLVEPSLKAWYLNFFRGANNNDDCLIGVYNDGKGSFYYSLTARGKSAYLNTKQNQIINIASMNKNHIAVNITEKAKGNLFIDSEIHGGVRIAGQDNSFLRTRISKIRHKHPFWFWLGIFGTTITIITGIINMLSYFSNPT